MSIFEKLFRRKKQVETMDVENAIEETSEEESDIEETGKEECAMEETEKEECGMEETSEEQQESWQEEDQKKSEPIQNTEINIGKKDTGKAEAASIKQKALHLSLIVKTKEPVTYENFLECSMISRFDELYLFVKELLEKEKLVREMLIQKETLLLVAQLINDVIPVMGEIKEKVYQFREKDAVLRKQILDYTAVIKQINDKKLKKEEFEQVKEKLDPKLQALKASREEFVKEEKCLNREIAKLVEELIVIYDQVMEIAKKI